MSSATPMNGDQVKGYRTLNGNDIERMNDLKSLSRQFCQAIADLRQDENVDPRWLSIARTHMQQACMAACRAVAKPDDDC